MNDSSDMRVGRQELGLFCYYKVLKLPMKWTGISYKCILQTLRQSPKKSKNKFNLYTTEEEKKESH